MPKVNRIVPEFSSTPGTPTSMPSRPAISPRTKEPRLSDEIITRARSAREKFSKGPNCRPSLASGGDSSTSAIQDNPPPTTEALIPRPSARPGWPARASGYPSRVVMTEDGSPGIRIKVAVINPPLMPPTYILINSVIAFASVM